MLRNFYAVLVFTMLVCLSAVAHGQNAQIRGRVTDSSGAIIRKASVRIVDQQTNIEHKSQTDSQGQYVMPALNPSLYRIFVSAPGFSTSASNPIPLSVDQNAVLDFKLRVGSDSVTVTVDGSAASINTTDAAVSTVIDRQFVQDIPMNGRSFQSLVLLSPGVVTNTPQYSGNGEYSVNGMRSDANNFTVDGASASNAPSNASNAGSAGMLPSASMLGTTHAMLSIDAMEEFRITTSTYSAEYGRQPGAQVSFRSRSGTNEYHGSLFDYLRNSVFDANNWFNTYSTPIVPTPAERQNDFGGTIGGPVSIPHLYSGKDRLFLFFSYEGLRVDQPLPASIYDVPSNGTYNNATYAHPQYENLRKYAPPALQPVLNAWPLPNCSTAQDSQCVDYGLGGSPYIWSPKSKGAINAINARIDYQILPTMRIFFRYQDTTSNTVSEAQNGPYTLTNLGRNRVYLVGANNTFGGSISNELRLQYAPALFNPSAVASPAGGANPINLWTAQGLPSGAGENEVFFSLPNQAIQIEEYYGSQQFQPNAVDAVTWTHGKHLFKAGIDYRQTTAYYGDGKYSRGPYAGYTYSSAASVLANTASIKAVNYLRTDPTAKNLGIFAQDEWRLLPRLSLSLGLRWDFSPPPSVSGAPMYTYTGNVSDPSTLGLSQPNAPLYKTTYTDFAPRFGMALVIHNQPGHELVLRGGGGLFYDSIPLSETFGNGDGVGTATTTSVSNTPFPLTASQILIPVASPPRPPYLFEQYPSNQLAPPSTIQWNTSLEQAVGQKQTVTIGYVASLGKKLINYRKYALSSSNASFPNLYLYENGPGSNYNSLQVKYQRQMANGLQAIASYTWSHAIDWRSLDSQLAQFPLQRGDSDQDVRHNFVAALVYNLPTLYSNRLEKAIFGYWNADLWFVARTAFPYEPVGPTTTDPITGENFYEELNYNGKSPYVYKAGIPGGRQIDPTIFSVTSQPLQVGTAPRNFLRGFGEIQANISIQRDFPLYERAKLQFRAEAFNIANHPNFGTVNTTCGVTTAGGTCNNAIMGQATTTLSNGLGGLSSLYQQGGPRSLEFVLKLQF